MLIARMFTALCLALAALPSQAAPQDPRATTPEKLVVDGWTIHDIVDENHGSILWVDAERFLYMPVNEKATSRFSVKLFNAVTHETKTLEDDAVITSATIDPSKVVLSKIRWKTYYESELIEARLVEIDKDSELHVMETYRRVQDIPSAFAFMVERTSSREARPLNFRENGYFIGGEPMPGEVSPCPEDFSLCTLWVRPDKTLVLSVELGSISWPIHLRFVDKTQLNTSEGLLRARVHRSGKLERGCPTTPAFSLLGRDGTLEPLPIPSALYRYRLARNTEDCGMPTGFGRILLTRGGTLLTNPEIDHESLFLARGSEGYKLYFKSRFLGIPEPIPAASLVNLEISPDGCRVAFTQKEAVHDSNPLNLNRFITTANLCN